MNITPKRMIIGHGYVTIEQNNAMKFGNISLLIYIISGNRFAIGINFAASFQRNEHEQIAGMKISINTAGGI